MDSFRLLSLIFNKDKGEIHCLWDPTIFVFQNPRHKTNNVILFQFIKKNPEFNCFLAFQTKMNVLGPK